MSNGIDARAPEALCAAVAARLGAGGGDLLVPLGRDPARRPLSGSYTDDPAKAER